MGYATHGRIARTTVTDFQPAYDASSKDKPGLAAMLEAIIPYHRLDTADGKTHLIRAERYRIEEESSRLAAILTPGTEIEYVSWGGPIHTIRTEEFQLPPGTSSTIQLCGKGTLDSD